MNIVYKKLNPGRCIILTIIIILSISYCHAQIAIQASEIQDIFMPGTQITAYIAPINSVNLGQKGGPHIYDFSSITFTDTASFPVESTNTIPELMNRYSPGSIIWGVNSDSERQNNQVFEFLDDTLFRHGQVSIATETQRYKHNMPPDRLIEFPAEYNASWEATFLETDTTYTNGVPTNIEAVIRVRATIIDGYGTLNVSGYNFACLRMKKTYSIPAPPDKEYWYLTREGALLIVNGAASEPDTGVVQISSVVLLLGESLVNSIPKTSPSPKNFTLNQNYPNPFNPVTSIEFTLPQSEFVQLKVFNVLGKEVTTLISNNFTQGNHSFTFEAKNLASGVYYYQLVAGEYREVKKMILLR